MNHLNQEELQERACELESEEWEGWGRGRAVPLLLCSKG